MLVALVVIAVSLSVATLALTPDPRRPLAREAERLALLFEQAREESQLSGTPIAWQWHADGYSFVRRDLTDDGARWLVVSDDEMFRERQLPDTATILSVRADGRMLAPGDRLSLDTDGAQDVEVRLGLGEARARILATGDGRRFEVSVGGEG